jgi:hypothetical protein
VTSKFSPAIYCLRDTRSLKEVRWCSKLKFANPWAPARRLFSSHPGGLRRAINLGPFPTWNRIRITRPCAREMRPLKPSKHGQSYIASHKTPAGVDDRLLYSVLMHNRRWMAYRRRQLCREMLSDALVGTSTASIEVSLGDGTPC